MENLIYEMRRALNLMRADGIDGWGLSNPDPEVFNLVETGEPVGCTSETCNHFSHDPAAASIKLVPRGGWVLSFLGSCGAEGASGYVEFYITWRGEVARAWRLDAPDQFWATVKEVQAGELPAWALAKLAEVAA